MNDLYTAEGKYTDKGNEMDKHVMSLLHPLFAQCANPRELFALITLAAGMTMSAEILDRQMKDYRARLADSRIAKLKELRALPKPGCGKKLYVASDELISPAGEPYCKYCGRTENEHAN